MVAMQLALDVQDELDKEASIKGAFRRIGKKFEFGRTNQFHKAQDLKNGSAEARKASADAAARIKLEGSLGNDTGALVSSKHAADKFLKDGKKSYLTDKKNRTFFGRVGETVKARKEKKGLLSSIKDEYKAGRDGVPEAKGAASDMFGKVKDHVVRNKGKYIAGGAGAGAIGALHVATKDDGKKYDY